MCAADLAFSYPLPCVISIFVTAPCECAWVMKSMKNSILDMILYELTSDAVFAIEILDRSKPSEHSTPRLQSGYFQTLWLCGMLCCNP